MVICKIFIALLPYSLLPLLFREVILIRIKWKIFLIHLNFFRHMFLLIKFSQEWTSLMCSLIWAFAKSKMGQWILLSDLINDWNTLCRINISSISQMNGIILVEEKTFLMEHHKSFVMTVQSWRDSFAQQIKDFEWPEAIMLR